ncbi:hypothetical protein [Paraclostridium bifermentans]
MIMSRSIRKTKHKQSSVYTLVAIADIVILGASFAIVLANW